MANRVLLGKKGTSDFGLFVSRSGDDVLTTTNPLSFDSRAPTSLTVSSFGQGILVPNNLTNTFGSSLSYTFEGTTYTSSATSGETSITHNLGYVPAYAIRWCTGAEMGFRVGVGAIPAAGDEPSDALEVDGPTVTSGEDTYLDFGVIFEGTGRTLKNTPRSATVYNPATGNQTFANNPNFYVSAFRSTASDSNVSFSGEFTDELTSGTDVGTLRFRPILTSGTTGEYSFLLIIEDSANDEYFMRVTGTVTSAAQTGRVASKVWTPGYASKTDIVAPPPFEEEEDDKQWQHTVGLHVESTTNSAINIKYIYEREVNNSSEIGNSIGDSTVCFYSYVIFTAPNFLNNRSF